MKKGLSPIISTVLMIALVLSVAGLVFGWTRYTVKTAQEEALELQSCSELKFVVGDFCYGGIEVDLISGSKDIKEIAIKFNGRNDVAGEEIEGFNFQIDYGGTIKLVSTFSPDSPESGLGPSEAGTFLTHEIEDVDNIREIKVSPIINVEGKTITCSENNLVVEGGFESC